MNTRINLAIFRFANLLKPAVFREGTRKGAGGCIPNEMVLQVIFTIYKLMHLKQARVALLKTKVVELLVTLVYDKNKAIQKTVMDTLDIVMVRATSQFDSRLFACISHTREPSAIMVITNDCFSPQGL